MLSIRRSTINDLGDIAVILRGARKHMAEEGNLTQWEDIDSIIEKAKADILSSSSYVIEDEKEVVGVFSLFLNGEPTYDYIEGRWLNNHPYATIHRIASSFKKKGILKAAVDYALSFGMDVRIDTHEQNVSMNAALKNLGFVHVGTIYISDGSPRLAYQLVKP